MTHGIANIRQVPTDPKLEHVLTKSLICWAVPSYLHILEFCMFLEEKIAQSTSILKKGFICDIRVLRGAKPNEYAIAVKLACTKAVLAFIKVFHQQRYNSIE